MALRAPRPVRSKCIREAIKKMVGLKRVATLGEYGPEGAKAIQRQMHKGSYKEKG